MSNCDDLRDVNFNGKLQVVKAVINDHALIIKDVASYRHSLVTVHTGIRVPSLNR